MPQFPPLPRVVFDPFGSLTGGFLAGLDYRQKLAEHGLRRAQVEAELQERAMKQQALQQYAATGDVSALRSYSPETEQAIKFSRAQEQIYKLHGAKEYLLTVLPFLRREQVPQLYRTLQQQFGIDTSGWSVPATDEEFERAKAAIWGGLTGARPPEQHSVFALDPSGRLIEAWRGPSKPHFAPRPEIVVGPGGTTTFGGDIKFLPEHMTPGGKQITTGYKLYRNPQTGEETWVHPTQAPPGWTPVDKPLVQEVFERIATNPRDLRDYSDAVRRGEGDAFIASYIESLGYRRYKVPKSQEEAVQRYRELIKKHQEYLKRLEELDLQQKMGVGP